eukprot:scaffold98708_cov45-Phaeocystis_antarctica.AAC.1
MRTEVGTSPVCPPPSPPCAQMMSTPASSALVGRRAHHVHHEYVGGVQLGDRRLVGVTSSVHSANTELGFARLRRHPHRGDEELGVITREHRSPAWAPLPRRRRARGDN